MFWNDKRKIRILFWFTVLWMISSFLGIAYYLWTDFFIMEAQADVFDNIMWAKASMESGSIVNENYRYPYIIPLGGHLLLIPFIHMFGMNVLTVRCGMTLFSILFIIALYMFLKLFLSETSERFFVMGLLIWLMLGTTKLREIFFAHVIHYSLAILLFMLGFYILNKINEQKGKKAYIIWCVIFLIHFSIIGIEGATVILFAGFPIITALFFELMCSKVKWKEIKFSEWVPLLCSVLGIAVGYVLYSIIVSNSQTDYGDGHMKYQMYLYLGDNINEIIKKWFALFLKMFSYNEISWDVFSKNGILYTIKIGLGLMLPLFSLLSVIFYKKIHNKMEKMIIVAHWSLCFFTLFFAFFGTIAIFSGFEWRFIPVWFSSIIVTIIIIRRICLVKCNFTSYRLGIVALLVLVINSMVSIALVGGKKISTDIWFGEGTIIDVINEYDVSIGFCTDYWMCPSVSVITGEKSVTEMAIEDAVYLIDSEKEETNVELESFFLICTRGELEKYPELLTNAYAYEEATQYDHVWGITKEFVIMFYNLTGESSK